MFRYLLAENIKIKHSFLKKLVWMAPLVTMMLSFVLAADFFQIDNYNWWYTTICPGVLSLSCALLAEMEKKMNNRAILSLPVSLKQVWTAKIIVMLEILAGSCMIIFGGSMISSLLMNPEYMHMIPIRDAFIGSIILIITFMWQIPLCLFLGSKIGLFPNILVSVAVNVLLGILGATESIWVFIPYTYPSRLMCPILKILPNGLPAAPGSVTFKPELLSYQVIFPGVFISVILFLLLTYVTGKWFEHQEAK